MNAYSKRDVIKAAAGLSLVFQATSVGVTVLAMVAGTAMSQDASDMVVYGNAKQKTDENKTFDSDKFMAASDQNGASGYYDKANKNGAELQV